MKKIAILLISIFLINFAYSSDLDFPKYLTSGKDTIGVIFTLKQAQQIDNDYELLDILTKMKIECDSLNKYWIQVNDEKGKLISLFKLKIQQNDSLISIKDEKIENLNQQIKSHIKNEKDMQAQLDIRSDQISNLKKDNRKLKIKSILGWTGTTTGVAAAIVVITYFGIKFGFH